MKKGLIVMAVLTYLFVGCASNSGMQVAASECPTPPDHYSEYLIGTGDTLNIVVWRDAGLSAIVPVRPDGKISTPLIDDMQASGKTPSQLGADMETVLGEYLRTAEVSVIVTGQGAANQIRVIGEVNSPQSLSYRDRLTLLDVLVAVGGLTDFAAGNRANLIRQTQLGPVECQVKLKNLVRGDMSHNIDVFPGDVLVIPETRF